MPSISSTITSAAAKGYLDFTSSEALGSVVTYLVTQLFNHFSTSARSWKERVEFVGVVYQDEEPKARAYLAQRGNEYRQFMDPDSKCAIEYGVAGVPETFFIDADGVIRYKQTGPVTPTSLNNALGTVLARAQP